MDDRDKGMTKVPKSPPAYDMGRHQVSLINFDSGVQGSYAFRRSLTVFGGTTTPTR